MQDTSLRIHSSLLLYIFVCIACGNIFSKNIRLLSTHIEKPQNKKVRCKKDILWQIFEKDLGKWTCVVKLKYTKAELTKTYVRNTDICMFLYIIL